MQPLRQAVFLDRDGVILQDVSYLVNREQIRVFGHTPRSLELLSKAGFTLIVVSNQAAVARGLISCLDVINLHTLVTHEIISGNGPLLDGFYFCPHHPNATVPGFRVVCDCRKPKPGLILRAATEHRIDLSKSFMVGDRVSDIVAGKAAGCRTVLVQTGAHQAPPIETDVPFDITARADHTCLDLSEAANWIVEVM